ncbi:GNAT family N-acetyltransferase [Roseovarius sp. SCSIO 43702]|uniref:GNAT family N-acetyltransferase n=1 Tax=Roseovarius sp. SCSIO 43702 TaxID=2823043 RepID=UPI001C72DA6B|nr:GNAT family N-acetyltransferase [Roseovarius sp. SCSIO 43702]QYX55802.1 GNAT family N-acetyltransferase [Roseovarius sp. SCSIO 43702]
MLIVEPADPLAPGPRALLEASHALMAETFPPGDIYALDLADLTGPDIRFFTARDGAEVLGTGALAICRGYGEVKSMFTAPQARGRGVAAALLRRIEDEARDLGLPLLRLETGAALASAVRLYARHGFVECDIFGSYEPNGTSLYMEKRLAT